MCKYIFRSSVVGFWLWTWKVISWQCDPLWSVTHSRNLRVWYIYLLQKLNYMLYNKKYKSIKKSCHIKSWYGSYIAPECRKVEALTEKCDIYSFGVVLLELITGKTANSGDPDPYQTLAQFVSIVISNLIW